MADYGVPGSATHSTTYTGLDDMIGSFPNNLNNEIDARDMRNALLTLWNKISEVELSSTIYQYNNNTPSVIGVGGINVGTTFSNTTLDQMFNTMFYPYQPPLVNIFFDALSSTSKNMEYGSSNLISLYWYVTKKTNPIISILVNGSNVVPTGITQNGILNTTSVQNVNTTFTITISDDSGSSPSVSDGPTVVSKTITNTWLNKRYWGFLDLSSLGNPNLTLNPSSSITIGSFISSSTILSLTGAGVGTGSELSNNRLKTYTNIDGSGKYLIFAFPTTFGTPSFNVNGLTNTAFTKVKSSFLFTNTFGYVTNYDVWITNTQYNSPTNIIIN